MDNYAIAGRTDEENVLHVQRWKAFRLVVGEVLMLQINDWVKSC